MPRLALAVAALIISGTLAACGPSAEEVATMTAAAWTDTPSATATTTATTTPTSTSIATATITVTPTEALPQIDIPSEHYQFFLEGSQYTDVNGKPNVIITPFQPIMGKPSIVTGEGVSEYFPGEVGSQITRLLVAPVAFEDASGGHHSAKLIFMIDTSGGQISVKNKGFMTAYKGTIDDLLNVVREYEGKQVRVYIEHSYSDTQLGTYDECAPNKVIVCQAKKSVLIYSLTPEVNSFLRGETGFVPLKEGIVLITDVVPMDPADKW